MLSLRVTASLRVILIVLLAVPALPAADVDYTRDVKPLFAEKCGACHGALKQEASLRLDAGALIQQGGDSGAVIVAGDSSTSLLIDRITADDPADRMPPEGEGEPFSPEQVELIKAWIEGGAGFPADEEVPADPRDHWAYQLPQRPAVPDVDDPDWSRHPIDAFIAARHREQGIAPVAQADRRTLLRRLYLDLIGIPPTREQQHAFLADESSDAYDRVVERLLDSPQHAERWARHWMDVWRYSDWDGYRAEVRGSHKHIWRWREWIVDSLLADKPYDRMVREMLAADELAPGDEDAIRATGFLVRQYHLFNRDMWLDNTVEHTCKAFLAVTINCSKCHDHKYDPIPQHDYYAIRAVFEPYRVRIDRLPGQPDIQQDGLVRAYDAEPDTPTYVFLRGNEKHPDKEHPVAPTVPELFDHELSIVPAPLPVESWYPDLKDHVIEESLAAANDAVQQAQAAQQKAKTAREEAATLLASLKGGAPIDEPDVDSRIEIQPVITDDFSQPQPELWTLGEGEWSYMDGRLRQDRVSMTRSEIVSQAAVPEDFTARVRFRILGGTTYHSVGLSFDVAGDDSEGVYLSAHPPGPKVQVMHIRDGKTVYPPQGNRAHTVELNREYVLEVAVRDRLLNVSVDGTLLLAYALPQERQAGRFSLWSYDTKAEFLEAVVAPLPEDTKLAKSVDEAPVATPEQAGIALADADSNVKIAEQKVTAAEAALTSLKARMAADRAKHLDASDDGDWESLAASAADAERRHQAISAEVSVSEAQQNLTAKERAVKPDDQPTQDAVDAAQKALDEAHEKLKAARTALEKTDAEYSSFGEQYPQTSTGRRLALANWIASPDNPLTARVAVNHIWLRHFGAPLVESVFDFGLRAPEPLHHDLLDWLAVEFMEHGWSMQHLHRLIVTSHTYRLASSSNSNKAHGLQPVGVMQIDPDNHAYWRANVRRLDAEAVRDSVLATSGSLDLTRGGPDIDFATGESVFRRSLYFRHAYEKQMPFLVLFDAASPNECYRRSESIIPQQALAMANSTLSLSQSRLLARSLTEEVGAGGEVDDAFVNAAFEQILCRTPADDERSACREFLSEQYAQLTSPDSLTAFSGGEEISVPPSEDPALRARENLVHVLMNHNDFVTVR